MATQGTAERDARLDALLKSAEVWAATRKKQLTDAVKLSKAILRARTGSDRLAASTVAATSDRVIEAIDDFLKM